LRDDPRNIPAPRPASAAELDDFLSAAHAIVFEQEQSRSRVVAFGNAVDDFPCAQQIFFSAQKRFVARLFSIVNAVDEFVARLFAIIDAVEQFLSAQKTFINAQQTFYNVRHEMDNA